MMAKLPPCRCGGLPVVRWNPIRACWDALCDTCPVGFWGLSKILAEVEWGRAMRDTTYVLDAEPIQMGMMFKGLGE